MDKWAFLRAHAEESWHGAGKPKRVLAAVSGGADSMALLETLFLLSREKLMQLFVAHVDHGLRPSSKEDGEFVAHFCRERGLPCRVIALKLNGDSENAAREGRYQALYQEARRLSCDAIALAHHQRDQAETMLLHLFRGSGLKGISGMQEIRMQFCPDGQAVMLWRPFLDIPAELLVEGLKERGIPWREDETNAADQYQRNFLRHHVLPVIARRFPGAEEAMGRAGRILQGEDAYLNGEAEAFLEKHACRQGPCRFILLTALKNLHPAMQYRVLRAALPFSLTYEKTMELAAISQGDTINLPRGWKAVCSKTRLHFMPPHGEAASLGAIRVLPFQGNMGDGLRMQAAPKELLGHCQLRLKEAGDEMHPLGGPGVKSMQDYWVDKKIDRPFRSYLPVLCMGQRVVWSIGVGPGEEMRVQPGQEAVLLQYIGYLPGEIPGYHKE